MTTYANGRIPAPGQPGSPLTTIATGTDSNGYWEFQISGHTLWMWNFAKAYAANRFGKTLHIRTGWNCYRPYPVQVAARQRACAAGNCNAAASAGYSSHGGTWIDSHFTGGVWVDAMAIDVDPNGLTWAQVWEACTAAGFLCNAITVQRAGIEEPWHIIDLHPWDAVPSDVNVTPFDVTPPTQGDDMPTMSEFLNTPAYDGGPTISQFFKNVDQGGVATQVWGRTVDRGTDASGAPVRIPALQELADAKTVAMTTLATLRAGVTADVDETALAAALAPLLTANLGSMSDEDVQRIAKAAADEQARRLASAPAQ